MKRFGVVVLVALVGACGSNRPEIPRELLVAPEGCGALDYPDGPYGTEAGSVAADQCFSGWARPAQVSHDEESLHTVSFSHFYDPTGDRYELLLVNSAALWCAACEVEHQTLPDHYEELAPKGLAVLGAVFQDRQGDPATLADLTLWVETFGTTFPMVLDPDYQLGAYAPAASAPLNLLIDARTMRIVEKFVGDQGNALWEPIEKELDRREAE
jgi:hypothetical protein